jgi:hypothetical protein
VKKRRKFWNLVYDVSLPIFVEANEKEEPNMSDETTTNSANTRS